MDHDYYKNKKILIVDDEPQLLEMVSSILAKDESPNTRPASPVSQAVEKAREYQPDLAVLDVMLPDGDGFGLLEKLREFTRIPVLFLTARGEDEDRIKGLGAGADDYMVKPFLPKELTLRIGIILKRYYKEDDPLVKLAACEIDFERAQVIKAANTFR